MDEGSAVRVLALVLSLLSLGTAAIALWYTHRTDQRERQQLDYSRRQFQETFAFRKIDWAMECIRVLRECHQRTTSTNGWSDETIVAARCRLSALLDIGRLYYPNGETGTANTESIEGYKGYRDRRLDPLRAGLIILDAYPRSLDGKAFDAASRLFLSYIHTELAENGFRPERAPNYRQGREFSKILGIELEEKLRSR